MAEPIPADPLLDAADELYRARDWTAARVLLEAALTRHADDPTLALPLAIAHCRIEQASTAALDLLSLPIAPPTQAPRETALVAGMAERVTELCHGGDFPRAVRLLRLLVGYDPAIADCYARCIVPGRTACSDLPEIPNDAAPPFLARHRITEPRLAQLKRQHAGARVLVVGRRFFAPTPTRQYETTDNLVLSAARFGLAVAEMNSHFPEPGTTTEEFPARLDARIQAMRPNVILADELFNTGMSSATDAIAAGVGAVLARARRDLGTRVVKTSPDSWWIWAHGREQLFRGLGESVDLVQHCHPTILGGGTDAQNARVFCYLLPTPLPAPTVPYGTIPRAAFIGGISPASGARLVLWAECSRLGLPIDFRVGASPWATGPAAQLDDADYARALREHQLIVNITRRPNGVPITVGRTIETMLCGGVLVEEDSIDTAHFFKRFIHYVPFTSLADLQALVPRLLADPVRRQRLVAAGQPWATTYFSGDHFWAGLLDRLFD